ncbi:asparagine--tRNA ligase [Artemisia annua]|uniref:Asparagine--tRNA ligase n=1 Tax=Artemisia annua TaxID=35608 RepID=A0A2U1M348_ARTAN|nr:asparagine--tRNA ligase [Artemisia annua]
MGRILIKFESPKIVYNYPKGVKAFYMKVNPDKKTVNAMDILMPKVGELIGGSHREKKYVLKERYEKQSPPIFIIVSLVTQFCHMRDESSGRSRMLEMGLPLEPYEWYLDLRRFGTEKVHRNDIRSYHSFCFSDSKLVCFIAEAIWIHIM